MDSLLAPAQDVSKDQLEASSALKLLESGLSCFQQGYYTEGIAFFTLVREQLSPNTTHLTEELNALLQNYVSYCQAQQTLQEASERLVQAYAKQQAHIASLAQLLAELLRETDSKLSGIATKCAENQHRGGEGPVAGGSHGRKSGASTSSALPALHFTCFGCFEVKRGGKVLSLCPNRNGQAILRYIVTQPNYQATMDTLMELLWPEDDTEVAHHKLQVAVSALRRSLNDGCTEATGGGYILCKKGIYQLNPHAPIQTDTNEFLVHYQAGRQQNSKRAAVPHYEAACQLYKGPFLTEDLYVDWPIIQREQLNQAYVAMCSALSEYYRETKNYEDATKWASAILKQNPCEEIAHRHLMCIYFEAGRRCEALRQYHRCERILAEELNIPPMSETVSLFHTIQNSASST